MTKFFLAVAVWDSVVAVINLRVLPHFVGAEAMKFGTVSNNALPIVICLCLAAITSPAIRGKLFNGNS